MTRADQEAYDALKEQWRQRLLAVLHLRFPGTKDHVAFCDISTPLTIENYMRPGRGAAIGLDVTPERFVDGDEIVCRLGIDLATLALCMLALCTLALCTLALCCPRSPRMIVEALSC